MKYKLFLVFLLLVSTSIWAGNKNKKRQYKTKKGYQSINLSGPDYQMELRARKWKRGELVFVKIHKKKHSKSFKLAKTGLYWRKKRIPLNRMGRNFVGFIALNPSMRRGTHELTLVSKNSGNRYTKRYKIDIEKNVKKVVRKKKKSKISYLKVKKKYNRRRYSKRTLAFIRKCLKYKKKAFRSRSKFRLNRRGFQYPLKKIHITSPFNAYRHYSKKKARKHSGVDFRGKVGTRIYAVAPGRVVLARKMYFEGYFTVIDHGANIYSLYMHQSRIRVRYGQIVKKGQYIGRVGATGRVTGPHLHLGLRVNGIMLNPMSAIQLKFN